MKSSLSETKKNRRPLFQPENLHRLHLIDGTLSRRELRYWRRQGLAIVCLLVSLVLSIPTVPGPGFVFFLLGVILADFPYKHRLVDWLRHKRWFRLSRVYLRKRWNLLIMLGEPWNDEILHPELAEKSQSAN